MKSLTVYLRFGCFTIFYRRNDSTNVQTKKFTNGVDENTDGGWGWVVVGGAFFALMTEMGIVQTLGLFVDPLEQEFSSGAAVMGVIASACFATLCAMCKCNSLSTERFGPLQYSSLRVVE